MRFSERYGYKVNLNGKDLLEKVPKYLRTRIWNVLCQTLFENIDEQTKKFIINIWDKFFKKEIPQLNLPLYVPVIETLKQISGYSNKLLLSIKKEYYNLKWFEVLDFFEFLCEYYPDKEVINRLIPFLNKVLEEEKSAYRVIDGIVTPLIDKEEIKEVEKALNPPDKFAPVREHMRKALERFSDKKQPDYQNSIKECMSALDSLISVIKGKKTIFPKFVKELDIHKALKDGFLKLYAWSSDAEGIRHGITGEDLRPLIAEARYMLVTVSTFINYVIAKYDKGEINGKK